MIVSYSEAMNPSRRNTMEDRHSIHFAGSWKAPDPTMSYLGIYDGHGGRDMVDFLEHAMPFHVAQELQDDDTGSGMKDDNNSSSSSKEIPSMETRLERAFLMADLHARQVGITSSGATVAVCLVKPLPESHCIQLSVANSGDARVVLGQHGQPAERLSVDHRVDDPQEVQRIAQAGGFCWKGRVLGILAVTRSLGDHLLKEFVIAEPAVRQIQIPMNENGSTEQSGAGTETNQRTTSSITAPSKPSSFVILACDGLWDVMSDQEAVDAVREFEGEKRDVAEKLVQEGLTRGSTDNLTVIVAWL